LLGILTSHRMLSLISLILFHGHCGRVLCWF
jgi:hypothetical protein